MLRGRLQRSFICLTVAVVMGAGLFIGPGIRHRHDGGDAAHSHRHVPAHSHAHGHGHSHHHDHGLSHSHPHSHSHSHGHDHTHSHSESIAGPAESHVHVTIFGFELTLPDVFGGEDAPLTASASGVSSRQRSEHDEGLFVTAPSLSAEWLQFWFRVKCVNVRNTGHDHESGPGARWTAGIDSLAGIDRAEPPEPPPRTA